MRLCLLGYGRSTMGNPRSRTTGTNAHGLGIAEVGSERFSRICPSLFRHPLHRRMRAPVEHYRKRLETVETIPSGGHYPEGTSAPRRGRRSPDRNGRTSRLDCLCRYVQQSLTWSVRTGGGSLVHSLFIRTNDISSGKSTAVIFHNHNNDKIWGNVQILWGTEPGERGSRGGRGRQLLLLRPHYLEG